MLKYHNFSLGLVWLIILFIIPLPFIQTLSTGLPIIYISESQAIYCGAIAYSWMLSAIYLATKPKWLDRLIGLPDIFMIHGIISIAAIILAYFHEFGTTSQGWIKSTGSWALYLLTGIMIYSLIFMAGWLTNRIPILLTIKHVLEKLFKHEFSVWLHRINIIATVLVFIHVELINYIIAIKPFMFWFYIYSGVTLATYILQKINNRVNYIRGNLAKNISIAQNIQELTIILDQHQNWDVRIGDYVFIAFPEIKGLKEYHPFSIVNIPVSSEKIVLAIRGDGDFTKLLSNVKVGSKIKLDGGFGRYQPYLKSQSPRARIVILAGGIGVTPLLSIVDKLKSRNIIMFYSAHRSENLIYIEKLIALKEREHFSLHYQIGRYKAFEIVRKLPKNWQQNTLFLISGPSPMIYYWKKALKIYGIKNGQIYAEQFIW